MLTELPPLVDRGYLLLDGPTGTELVRRGHAPEPHLWTARAARRAPELLLAVHRDYLAAGAELLTANTFRASSHQAEKAGLPLAAARALARESVALARQAIAEAGGQRWLLGSLGPLEDCYHPERTPEEALLVRVHAQTAEWLAEAGCDLLLCETLGTRREALAALRAGRRTGLPTLVSLIPGAGGGSLLSGEPLLECARACAAEGAEAVLVNCVHADVVDRALRTLAPLADAGVLLGAYGNAARMHLRQGEPEWEPALQSPAEYAARALRWVPPASPFIVGSCCGTTPEHVRLLGQTLSGWVHLDSNQGPQPYQGCALTN